MDAPSTRSNLDISKNRYTSIVVSVVIFLLLTSGVLVTSIYNSLKIRDLRAGTTLSSDLRSDIPTLTQEIYLLNIMRQQQQPASALQSQAAKITQLTQELDKEITTLNEGGNVAIRDDEDVYKPPVAPDQIEYVQNTLNLWTPYKQEATSYVDSQSVLAASTLEDRFGESTQGIYDNATALSNSLGNENGQRAGFLRNLQVFGISFAILYFIIFVLYFVRRLKSSDEELITARRETQEIMQTVNTGLFLLDKDLKIGQQHSRALNDIIGADSLAGENLTSVLRGRISDKDLNTTKQFIEQLYNPRVKEKLVDSLNPLHKVMLHNAAGNKGANSRFLDFKFSRVYDNKDIARILVNVNDVSDAVYLEQRLEKERSQNDMQIEMLTTILNVNPKIINEFIANTDAHINKMNNILKNPGSSQFELESKLKAIYREMHSLKGEASALKLHSFTKIASDAEDKLHALQNQGQLSGNDFLPLAVHLDDLLSLSNTIATLGERINRSAPAPTKPATTQKTTALNDAMAKESAVKTATPDTAISHQPASLSIGGITIAGGQDIDLNDEPKDDQLSFYRDFAKDIAARQGKQIQLNSHTLAQVNIPEHLAKPIKEIGIQLLRNAVVHGVEAPSVRHSLGKDAAGKIDLEVQDTGQDFMLIVQDDGQGIDYDGIRHKLVEENHFNSEEASQLTHGDLLKKLFASGFSTRDDADEDGGRGVGLDIIKALVKDYGGKLNVNSELGKMTQFVITLPKA
ncbi:ATP-binding protein [Psychrobacter sp. AOP22-C1-22]|uniref:ATP-binding protein n=1 Tax=unclassified Psychrobacter TaxID=196806 RepID=UPI00298EF083|nr:MULTISPECIES: ATP-binding protein [unclassified Psychrobacter]